MRRVRGTGALALLLIPLVFLPGCYGAKLLREPVTVDETAADVATLREQQADALSRIRALEDLLSRQTELLRQAKAEDQARWDDLEARLLAIDSKLQDALARNKSRPAETSRYGGSYWSGQPADRPEVAQPAHADSARAPSADPEAEIKRIYDQAYLDETKGSYPLAILGFREYLRRAPESELADNAQYWIGEAFYAQRDFEQAISEFLKVLSQYPKGDKVAGALLKTGYSFLQLDDHSSARRYLSQVVEEYPNSDEAKLAKAKLSALE